jgi:uncharacterized glyoxalase superfamily protein PhnB
LEEFMLQSGEVSATSLVPLMRYRDIGAAIDWLCTVLGFEKQMVVASADGTPYYAQLTFGHGMVMLGPVRDSDLDRLMRQPDEIGGVETQSCYLVVDEVDAHYARTKAAGAEIVLELKSDGSGGRGYSCRDPQGHIWNFGTYNPWKSKLHADDDEFENAAPAPRRRFSAKTQLFSVVVGIAAAAWWLNGPGRGVVDDLVTTSRYADQGDSASRTAVAIESDTPESVRVGDAATHDQGAHEASLRAAEIARQELAREKSARETAERVAHELQGQLKEERAAKQAAIEAASRSEAALAEQQSAKATVEPAAEEAKVQPSEAQDNKQAALSGPDTGQPPAPTAELPASPPPTETGAVPPAPSQSAAEAPAADPSTADQQAAPPRGKPAVRFGRLPRGLSAARRKDTVLGTEFPWPYASW